MISFAQLWLPILLSGIFVFIASFILHMLLKFWHTPDYRGFNNEDEVRAAIRNGNAAPGMYLLPWCTHEAMKQPAMQEKLKQGPVGMVLLRPSGVMNMGKFLGQWILFCLFIALLCAFIARSAVPAGAPFQHVFHVVGIAAFLGFACGAFPNGIWWGQPWRAVAKDVVDGVIYAVITAATFAWLWPHAL